MSAAFYALTRSWGLAVSSFLSGTLVDADHLLDFWREYGLRADLRRIFAVCHGHRLRRAVLFLHAWEWFFAGLLAARLTEWNPVVSGTAIGLGFHLVLDQVANRPEPAGYWFFWRLRRGFSLAAMFGKREADAAAAASPHAT